jgi:hypothetical protein
MAYTKELLEEILLEGGGTLLEEYSKYTQRLRIRFRCSCGNEASKKFEMLKLYRLPYCDKCSLKVKEQHKQATNLKRFGFTNCAVSPEIKKRINETYLKKFGGHPKRTQEVQEKWTATCLEKYGGHPNQNRELQIKSEFKGCHYKEFKFPSGRTVKVQGYEHLALEMLLQGYTEDMIVVGKANVPTVEYWIHDKRHVYFPDIYLPTEHKLIEVKSEWSMKFPTNVEEKALASIADGYAYEIWVYNGLKKLSRRIVYACDGSKENFPA